MIAIGQAGESFPDSPTGSTRTTGPVDAGEPAAWAAQKPEGDRHQRKDIVRTAAERGKEKHRNAPFPPSWPREHHQPRRWVVGLWNQCADEHHQQHRCPAPQTARKPPSEMVRNLPAGNTLRKMFSSMIPPVTPATACKKEVRSRKGPWKDAHESLEYESSWAFGANCGNSDVNAIAKLIDQCNDYGFDTIEMGNVVSVYQEACQKGYANGGSLEWVTEKEWWPWWTRSPSEKESGTNLPEGAASAAESFGHGEMRCRSRPGHPGL